MIITVGILSGVVGLFLGVFLTSTFAVPKIDEMQQIIDEQRVKLAAYAAVDKEV